MTTPMTPERLQRLELELRRLVGVTAVAFAVAPEGVVATLTLLPGAHADEVREEARQRLQYYSDSPSTVEVVALGDTVHDEAAATGRQRVKVIDVRTDAPTRVVEVRLGWKGREAVGSSPASNLADAVRATVAALTELGADIPFRLESATLLRRGTDSPVLVVFRPQGGGQLRMGVAQGATADESACRATMHALNRHLEMVLTGG